MADLADLAADADRHAVGLERPDEGRQLGRPDVVLALLFVDGRLRQVDQRGGVDVDVAIAGVDREPAGAPDLLGHRLRVGRVLLRIELVVIALDEDGRPPVGGDRTGKHRRRVVDRPLVGVGLLAAGQLDDDRTDVRSLGGLEHRARHVERLGAEVDGGHGEPGDLASAAGGVELLDARRARAELLAGLPDQPLRGGRRRLVGCEGRGPGEIADAGAAEAGLVVDDQAVAIEVGHRVEGFEEVGGGSRDVGHGRGLLMVQSAHGIGPALRPTTPASCVDPRSRRGRTRRGAPVSRRRRGRGSCGSSRRRTPPACASARA